MSRHEPEASHDTLQLEETHHFSESSPTVIGEKDAAAAAAAVEAPQSITHTGNLTEPYSNTDASSASLKQKRASIVPEGGRQAWLTITGAWFIMFAILGFMYSFGVFQDYYTRFLLRSHSSSKIAWIGSVQLMLPFFMGSLSGKLFDAGYFHVLEISGAVLFTISLFMLSLVKPEKYYQVFLSQGLAGGIGMGLCFVPTVSIVVHYFKRRRALATGIVLSGGGMGSVVFPIMLNHLIPMIGFKKAVQATAYIVLGCFVIGNCLMRTAYSKSSSNGGDKPNILGFFKDVPYLWALLSAVLCEFGIFFPVTYLQLFAIQHKIDPDLAFYSLSIINGTGSVGRVLGNFVADSVGPINLFIPCTLANVGLIFAIFGVNDKAGLVAFSVIFGFISGAWLSLTISSMASLARRPDEVGARTGIALAVGSFGALGAAPAQGALLGDEYLWYKAIIFSGVMLSASLVCIFILRVLLVKERGTQRV